MLRHRRSQHAQRRSAPGHQLRAGPVRLFREAGRYRPRRYRHRHTGRRPRGLPPRAARTQRTGPPAGAVLERTGITGRRRQHRSRPDRARLRRSSHPQDRRTKRAGFSATDRRLMEYTVFGAGAIGATVGAHMVRGGESVLFVDKDADHVRAMRQNGLTIRGFAETFTVPVEATTPDNLPARLQTVLLACKAPATEEAVGSFADRLAPDG